MAGGLTVPGGSVETTLKTSVYIGTSGSNPFSHAEASNGDVLLANGIDPVLRWSPSEARVEVAGMEPPTSPVSLGGYGVGTITGVRVAYLRWIDSRGRASNLSPISNAVDLGFDGLIDDITTDSSGVISVFSRSHGLTPGSTTSLVFSGVGGLASLNGQHPVYVVDKDTFTVNDLRDASGQWTQGGSWSFGVAKVTYSGIATPSDPKVVRRQILRNAEGSLGTLYVDVDTADLLSTNAESSRSDESLISQERVTLFDSEGFPVADRNAPPPSHKSAIVSHLGRAFLAADASYSEGCVTMTPGKSTVNGVGTAWRSGFVGRIFRAQGTRPRPIVSVDVANQVLTLDGPVDASVPSYSCYSIRPSEPERRIIYYSEAGDYESWPSWNAISLPDGDDEITGLVSLGSYLYVVCQRSVYRVVFHENPAKSATTFLMCTRGSVSHNCIVRAEDSVFMLDEQGIHAFKDSGTESASWPIQNLFRSDDAASTQINWSADRRRWHGSYDAPYETVRWFVHLDDDKDLFHAICYHTRLKSWWIEEYPFPVRSTENARVNGQRKVIAGIDARRVACLWASAPDIISASSASHGTVSSATSTTVVDTGAPFPSNLAGVPVAIASGTGSGQVRIISENTSDTITIVDPWDVTPDATSVYQIGGVSWWWRSPWYRMSEDQESNPRNIEILFKPMKNGGTLGAEYYFDQHETPEPFGYDKTEDYVKVRNGSPRIEFDMADRAFRPGFGVLRTEGHQDPYAFPTLKTSVMMVGVQGKEVHRIYSLTVLGAGDSDD